MKPKRFEFLAYTLFIILLTLLFIVAKKHEAESSSGEQYLTKRNGYIYKCLSIEKLDK